MFKKLYQLLLVLVVLVTCIGATSTTEASAANVDTDELIIADWLFGETVYYRDADSIISEYADAGITDVYLLVKGTGGRLAWQSNVANTQMSYSRDILKETCDAGKKYGVRIHAWMVVGQDSVYKTVNPDAIAYHFRVGTGSDVTQFMDLRNSDYQAYMRSLIKELNSYDIAGIHFDYIRYGTLFYDWGAGARNALINDYGITKDEYNAAVKAMCMTAINEYGSNYYYTTNSDGYYIYSSSGSSPSGVSFSGALAGQGSTDALNGATKIAKMRKDLVKNFISEVTSDLSDDKLISCAIMPESVNDYGAQAAYCQDPAVLKDVVDYVAIMSYASQYGGANTWPATLAKTCAADGCNAVAAIQTFDCENSNADPTCTDIYNEFYNVVSAKKTVAADTSISGKILGCAFFRAAKTTLASAYVQNSSTINFTVHAQDELGTALTKLVFTMKNGVKINSVSNKNGWSGCSFSISSDKTTLTITNSNGILGSYGSGTFTMSYTGTVSEDTGACMLQCYNSSGEDYAFCATRFPSHDHSYTSSVTTAATCTTKGVVTYTCACGDTYTENIAATGHSYSSEVTKEPTCVAAGVRTYTCDNCSDSYTEEISKGSHSYISSYNEATGITTYVCELCQDTYDSSCGLTHRRVETWQTGEKTHFAFCYNCNVGAEYSCYFEAAIRVNSTCTDNGFVTYVCAAHYNTATGDLVKDVFSEGGCTNTYTEVIPAGCNFIISSNLDGTHSKVCSACNTVAETADCTFVDGICSVCGYTLNDFTLLHFKANSPETTWNWKLANNTTAVSFGSASYGTMIGTNDASVTNPYFLVWPEDTCAINHVVAADDVVEVRFRLNVTSNADGVSSVTPDVRLQTGTNSFDTVTGNATESVSIASNTWQTVQIPIVGKTYSEGYTINRILFDPWSTANEIHLGADIEIDYIYIGDPDTAPSASADYLYFDFTNSKEAIRRYNNDIYEGNNFDLIPWTYSNTRNGQPTFDYSAEGTMTVPNILSTYAYVQTASMNGDLTSTPLNYTVGTGDVVEMRIKTSNLVAASNSTPSLRLYYIVNENSSTIQGVDLTANLAELIISGEYVTVKASLSAMKGKQISALRPQISGIKDDGSGNGKLVIDYIYVGPSDKKPSDDGDNLFFDFSRTEEDRIRYDTLKYGFFDYDTAGWGVNTTRCDLPTFDNETGTMSTSVTGSNPYLQIYADGPNFYNLPLNFTPNAVEMIQVRFKLEGLEAYNADGEANPRFTIKFVFDDETQASTIDYLSYPLSADDLTSGNYITATLPANDFLQGYAKVSSLQVVIDDVRAIPTKSGASTVTYDYIYVGPKQNGTNFIYFYTEDGSECLSSSVSDNSTTLTYNGQKPIKDYTDTVHYEFAGWADETGTIIDLAKAEFIHDTNLYATYTEKAHELSYTGTEEGHTSSCDCGYTAVKEAHNWNSGVITTPSTCEEDGLQTFTCIDCKYDRTEVLDAVGHNYNAIITNPTCTDDGYTTHTCSTCNKFYIDSHTDAIGHSYNVETVAPTCTEEGFTRYTCENCTDSFTNNRIDALGHDYDLISTAPTCTTAGSNVYTCHGCGDVKTEALAALGHSVVYQSKVEATCVNVGMQAHYECSTCNTLFVDEECSYSVPSSYFELPMVDHAYSSEITTQPTCTANGVKTFTCAGCHNSYTESLAAIGHDIVHYTERPATCTESGYSDHYRCSNCNSYYIDEAAKYAVPAEYVVMPATDHSYQMQTIAATCTTGEYFVYTCSICSDKYTEKGTAAHGHSYIYTNSGANHTVSCANCDAFTTEPHTYTNNQCICGAKQATDPQLDPNLTFSMNISAGAEMKVVYTVMEKTVKSYESFYLVVTKTLVGADAVTTVYGSEDDMVEFATTIIPTTGAAYMHRATYSGINAKEMGDTFEATLYAVAADGTIYCSNTSTTSIKKYLTEKIDDEESVIELKTMAVDMLKYGAAAQIRFDYDTDNLVTDDLTWDQLAYATQVKPSAVNSGTNVGTGVTLRANVSLQARVILNLTCLYTPTDADDLKYVVRDALTNDIIAELPVTVTNNVLCKASFEDVGAKQMRRLITATLYEGDTAVSTTMTWSVESYVASTRENTTSTADLLDLLDAMLIYGDSVAAYLKATNQG